MFVTEIENWHALQKFGEKQAKQRLHTLGIEISVNNCCARLSAQEEVDAESCFATHGSSAVAIELHNTAHISVVESFSELTRHFT
jgi:hypothetical protein